MDTINELFLSCRKIANNFITNKTNYDIKYDNNHIIPPKKYIKNNTKITNELEGLVTSSVSYDFLKSEDTTKNIIVTVSLVIHEVIEEYVSLVGDDLGLTNESIKIIFKGGLSMLYILKQHLENIDGNLKSMFEKLYGENFKKSDIDFGIIIDRDLPDQIFQTVYDDFSKLMYFMLNEIRSYMIKYNIEYNDFSRYNDIYKTNILKTLRTNFNKIQLEKGDDTFFCKIEHDNIIDDEPCPNDVDYEDTYSYDILVKNDVGNNIIVQFPKKIGTIVTKKTKNMYISLNDTIEFDQQDRTHVKFFLARLKLHMGFYSGNNVECCKYQKVSGELVDISITHKKTTTEMEFFDKEKKYNTINLLGHDIVVFSLDYLHFELKYMMNTVYKLPWDVPKYEKRLNRYFGIDMMLYLSGDKNEKVLLNINKLHTILLNKKNRVVETQQNKINELSNENWGKLSMGKFIIDILIKYEKLDMFIKMNNNENYNIFLDICLKNIDNFIGFATINEINKVNMQNGGYNLCNMKKSSYILSELIGIFEKVTNVELGVKLSMNTHEKFIRSYMYLIKNFFDLTPIDQVYYKFDGEKLYDSTTDNKYMIQSDGSRKVLRNYIQNISAIAFLSFVLEYHMFLITYEGYKYNTVSYPNSNNFLAIEWVGDNPLKRIYKNDLYEKTTYSNVFTHFCTILNNLYYRTIVKLISLLTHKINTTFFNNPLTRDGKFMSNDIKKLIVAIEHNTVDKYVSSSSYDFVYHHWKMRLVEKVMANMKTDDNSTKLHIRSLVDDCIRDAILYVTNQSVELDNAYTADSTGFFSWTFMNPIKDKNKNKRFGSCITSTCLENYLFARLYEHPKNFGVVLQGYGETHIYWKKTQKELNYLQFSHWTSVRKRQEYNTFNKKENEKYEKYRSSDAMTKNKEYLFLLPNGKINKRYLECLIYPIIDNYIAYIKRNADKIENSNKKTDLIETIYSSIKTIIIRYNDKMLLI